MNTIVRACVALLWLGFAEAAHAQAMDTATLQRLLQSTPKHDVRFTETRESQWLTAPVMSSGTMSASTSVLEKRVDKPRRETWRILKDRMQVVSPDTGATKEFLFKDTPAVAALADAMRQATAGDLAALEKEFRLSVGGDERVWTVQLTPRRPEVSRYLKQLDLQGSRGRLQVIVVLESQGDRTTTRLQYED